MNPTIQTLLSHRSVRRYTDDPVPEEHIRSAVEAGQMASTSAAVQAYCLIRVRDPEHRRRLVELTGGQEKVARAGAFFVVCGDVRRHRVIAQRAGKPYRARLEAFLVAAIDAALFAQNMCVALESMGLGICYIGGLRNRLRDVDELLRLPGGVYPLFGLCVGVPDERPAPRPRLPVDAVLFEGGYPPDEVWLDALSSYDEEYEAYLRARGAAPKPWTRGIAESFTEPARGDLAAYYESKGADLT
ncbi:MAG TPA: NADPH-dependent oxidoreductase [Phycisphaerales bacterium]|nr:NADPH-dependent oxidoreductase [Phycisphaerales bacterium]